MYQLFYDNLTDVEKKFAPKELNMQGDSSLLIDGQRISVVGSRKVSPEGIKRTRQLSRILVNKGFTVVSGLAEGVDTIAHKTAIELGGKTISVLGTSLDLAYPSSNKNLLETIKKNHLAVSQFSYNTGIQRKNFPIRNRTMALISDATIIVEATENSGTRHQGWEAIRLGRKLFILKSALEKENLTWAKEMIDYGAVILDSDNIDSLLEDVPCYTCIKEYAF